jgi:hypothetical protein
MKKYGWFASLGIVGAGALSAGTGCTITSTSGPGDDSGIVYLPEGGSDAGSDADSGAADANFCVPPDGSDSCTICLLQNCCAEEDRCASGTVDDAGNTDCQDLAGCFNDCIQPPADSGVSAGDAGSCIDICMAGHTAQGVADFKALEACGSGPCMAQCM